MNTTTKGKKTPKGKTDCIMVIQANLQKAKLAQLEVSKTISNFNKSNKQFVVFIQEPMVTQDRPVWQPVSCKRYSILSNPRTMMYTDTNREAWFIETFFL